MGLRVLVVDDHSAVHRGIEDILAGSLHGFEFGHAFTAQEAMAAVRTKPWDFAILDLSLPGQGGLELIRTMRDEQPSLRILVYTMYSETHFGARCMRAGADGYLTKDRPAEELAVAVNQVLLGRRYIGPETAAAMARQLDGKGIDVRESLSDREYEILGKIAQGKTPSEIARELSLSVKTVSTYRARLLEKLNLHSTAELIRYAVEQKFVP